VSLGLAIVFRRGVALVKEKINKLVVFFRDWDKQSNYLKWMVSKTKPFMGPFIFIFALNLLISVTGVGSTVVTKYIIDGVTGSGPDFTTLGVVVLILLTSLSIAISAVSGILATYINERYAFSIRSKVYDNILRGVWQKLITFHSGDIVTRLTSDIDRVANGISSIIPNIFLLTVRLGIAFCVLFYYDHFLALAALLLGPVGVFLSLIFSGRLRKYQEELNRTESEYRSFMQETVENIAVLKTFEQEEFCNQRLASLRDRRLHLIMKRNKLNMAMNLCIQVVFNAGYLVAFCWSIYRLSTNSITYGTMTIFLSLVAQVQGPIINLGSIIPQFITVLASAGRVIEMDSINSENSAGNRIKDGAKNIGLIIQDVSFAYGREKVLENVHLNIRPNDIVGIVGYSGSGKTTLVRLLLSLVYSQKGGKLIFYDDTGAIEEVSAAARRFISYVPQGNTLISGTIADNLRTGNQEATAEEMWQALEIAGASTFVMELEDGLNTNIGEKALGLSEGQAQRIAIARAIIKAAPILILDEATAALDVQTEEQVIKRLCESNLLHTCFIITHRSSMLNYCTRALEIEGKQLRELQLRRLKPVVKK
jgi:ABC-type bacteriocin/lantibiotic exporter with double-glycine peptidase domain